VASEYLLYGTIEVLFEKQRFARGRPHAHDTEHMAVVGLHGDERRQEVPDVRAIGLGIALVNVLFETRPLRIFAFDEAQSCLARKRYGHHGGSLLGMMAVTLHPASLTNAEPNISRENHSHDD